MIKITLFVILILLMWMDYHATALMIHQHDFTIESNPLMRSAMQITGSVITLLVFKIGALMLLGFVLPWLHYRWLFVFVISYSIVILKTCYTIYGVMI